MKISLNKILACASIGAAIFVSSCSDDFLKPEPLSFFEPEATFTTESGLIAAMGQLDRHLMLMGTNDPGDLMTPVHTQFLFSDMLVIGATDKTGMICNYSTDLIPSKSTYSSQADQTRIHDCIWFWNEFYRAVKYANSVLEFAPKVEGLDEETLNGYIGRAYFHRSLRYMGLVNMFGNIPLVTQMPKVPKRNYSSTSREAILKMLQEDMEFAVKWVPDQTPGSYTSDYPGGFVNKGACRILLAKVYMANYEYEKAKEQLDIVIDQSGYSLMRENFGNNMLNANDFPGIETWTITDNVIWDLHRPENVFNGNNKETILAVANAGTKMVGTWPMRNLSPFVFNNAITDPDGKQALSNYNWTKRDPQNDWLRVMGRGIATLRPTTWSQYDLWSVEGKYDTKDLRHSHEVGNWLRMEDLTYNTQGSKYYGQKLKLYSDDGRLLCNDTIRRWYNIPLYKLYRWDYSNDKSVNMGSTEWRGAIGIGSTNHTYIYRLAEAYLLRAECKLYMKQDGTSDVNEVRKRAHCEHLYTNVNIDDVFDERARELYLEEFRHDELVRASFCIAQSGITDREGNTYTIDEIYTPKGSDTDKTGGSFWYKRTTGTCPDDKHIGFNNGVTYNISASMAHPYYIMGKHNIFWPIPEFAIEDNDLGTLWQNYGYTGYNADIKLFTDWREAVADESR
ncbi:MAG: RagB/SusD family nutrient uptake outer membrane protein [Clostridiales bacterium]|nr:RagB/SusD family nutrient uptake outer membrane protein [Clostridiales bacterium]